MRDDGIIYKWMYKISQILYLRYHISPLGFHRKRKQLMNHGLLPQTWEPNSFEKKQKLTAYIWVTAFQQKVWSHNKRLQQKIEDWIDFINSEIPLLILYSWQGITCTCQHIMNNNQVFVLTSLTQISLKSLAYEIKTPLRLFSQWTILWS